MLSTSCVSGKIEYIEKLVVPEVSFAIFPDLEDAKRNGDGTVTVNEAWIVRLAEFKIRYEETMQNYNELKALYENKTRETAKGETR